MSTLPIVSSSLSESVASSVIFSIFSAKSRSSRSLTARGGSLTFTLPFTSVIESCE